MKVNFKNATIELVQGDITEQQVDAIVNSGNTRMTMNIGEVAKAIKKRGGKSIEEEALDKAPVNIGSAVVTSAGTLKADYIIHAAPIDGDSMTDIIKIKNSTLNSLTRADEFNVTSIAFPAFGTGFAQFPGDLCAQTMLNTIKEYLATQETQLKKIIIVLNGHEIYEIFQEVLKEVFE